MKTFLLEGGKKECRRCRPGMIIIATLFFLVVFAAVFSLVALYDSIG